MLGLRCYRGFSLVAAIGAYSLVAVHGLLLAVVSLVGQHQLWGLRSLVVAAWAQELRLPGSMAPHSSDLSFNTTFSGRTAPNLESR